MALRNMLYATDSNTRYTVSLDDWDSRGNVFGATMFSTTSAGFPVLPVTVRMRYVNAYLVSNPVVRRTFYIGNIGAYKNAVLGEVLRGYELPPAPNVGTPFLLWRITSCRGELIQF